MSTTNNIINPLPPQGAGLPHPLERVTSQVADGGAVLKLQTGLFELGRNRALHSGATTHSPEDQQYLEDHARAIALETYRDCFDPTKHAHDRVRENEYQAELAERGVVQQGIAHAGANLRDAEFALAKAAKAGEKPTPSPWLLAAAIIAIDLSVAPTLHDRFFFTITDDVLVWFASIVCAGFVAALLTLAMFAGRHGAMRRVGLFAGIGIGVALAVIRLSTTEDFAEAMFAVGLTVFEIAAVLLLEWVSRSLRDSEEKWSHAHKIEEEAIKIREANAGDLARWAGRLEDINKNVRDYLAYVEERSSRNLQVSELESVAVKAALDGYNAGIRENVGRILGVRRPQ